MIMYEYKIIISRRHLLTDEEMERKANYLRDSFETITYDRLLDTANSCDKQHHIYESDNDS